MPLALPRAASACSCSARRPRSATCPSGVVGRRRAGLDRQGPRPGARGPARARSPRSCGPCTRWPRGTPTRWSAAARPAPRWPRRCSRFKRAPRRAPAGAGDHRARCRARRSCCSTPAPTSRCGPSTWSSSRTWARRSWRPSAASRRRAWRCWPTAPRPSKGTEIVVAAHAALAASAGLNFVGNVEGFAIGTGEADVIVADGFTGNVALKVMEGVVGGAAGRGPRAPRCRRRARSSAACCCGPRCAGCGTRSTPRSRAERCCSACGRLAVVPHGSFGARGFARAIEVAARGVREDVAGRTHARLRGRGRAAERRPRRPLACPTSHDPRRSPRADPGASGRRAGARSCADHGGRRTSARTCRPTRWTSTRWCRSSRTPTA